MVRLGSALCLPGNHEMELFRWLRGREVSITHGLAESIAEIQALPEATQAPFRRELEAFLDGLVSH